MKVDAFSYELPAERIAQRPLDDREAARLLVVPAEGEMLHRSVGDLAAFVEPGTRVVVNDTRVIPARLLGHKDTGGKVEIFLVRPCGERTLELEEATRKVEVWKALGKASKALKFDSDIDVGPLLVRLLGRGEDGLLEVGLSTTDGTSVRDAIHAHGHVPLPPYIKREDDAADRERYQTVFARNDGAIAAPTAGLHLSRPLLGRIVAAGGDLASVTLHVGLGTFQPVTAEDLDDHPMHAEWFEISGATERAIADTRTAGGGILAVGTTVVRALESGARRDGSRTVARTAGETRLLIQPGYEFQIVDVLLTNFHLPKSTLLALVCAFGGTERVLEAYRLAVREGYRFFSYGDAMLLFRPRTPGSTTASQ